MSKNGGARRRSRSAGLVLGLDAYEKISAVENIRLSPDLKADLRRLCDECRSPEDRTRFITTNYGSRRP